MSNRKIKGETANFFTDVRIRGLTDLRVLSEVCVAVCTTRALPTEENARLSMQILNFRRRELTGTMRPYYALSKACTSSLHTVASSKHQDP